MSLWGLWKRIKLVELLRGMKTCTSRFPGPKKKAKLIKDSVARPCLVDDELLLPPRRVVCGSLGIYQSCFVESDTPFPGLNIFFNALDKIFKKTSFLGIKVR